MRVLSLIVALALGNIKYTIALVSYLGFLA